jgi:hypothetical protein
MCAGSQNFTTERYSDRMLPRVIGGPGGKGMTASLEYTSVGGSGGSSRSSPGRGLAFLSYRRTRLRKLGSPLGRRAQPRSHGHSPCSYAASASHNRDFTNKLAALTVHLGAQCKIIGEPHRRVCNETRPERPTSRTRICDSRHDCRRRNTRPVHCAAASNCRHGAG